MNRHLKACHFVLAKIHSDLAKISFRSCLHFDRSCELAGRSRSGSSRTALQRRPRENEAAEAGHVPCFDRRSRAGAFGLDARSSRTWGNRLKGKGEPISRRSRCRRATCPAASTPRRPRAACSAHRAWPARCRRRANVGAQHALCHHALPFTKEVGHDAAISDLHLVGGVGDDEGDAVAGARRRSPP